MAKVLVIQFGDQIFHALLRNFEQQLKIFWTTTKKIKIKSRWINGGDPTIANKTTKFFGQHPKTIWAMTEKFQSLDLVTESWQPKKLQLRFVFQGSS